MRDIKFRAFDKDRNRMFAWEEIRKEFDSWTFSDSQIMQYTGLKDINGTEIYEGDILHKPLQSAVPKFIIEWNESQCYFDEIPRYGNGQTKSHEFTVLGNIHENPELIN